MAHPVLNIERDGIVDQVPWWEIPGLAGQGFYNTPTGEYMSVQDEPIEDQALIDHGVDGTLIDSYLRVIRVLPEDTFVPQEYVLACITTALWWNKALDVTWLEMSDYRSKGLMQPEQLRVERAALAYVDDDQMHFGVITPDGEYRIQADCVTHIFLHEVIPYPESPREKAERLLQEAALLGCQFDG